MIALVVATRRFTLVLFTFPLGCDCHVSENFSSSSLIKKIHVRRWNLFGMKNKYLPFLLLSKGKLSYMPVAVTSTFPWETGDMCVCWLKQTSRRRASDQVTLLDRSSNPSHPTIAFDCYIREEGEIVLFARNCERFLYLEVKQKMFLTETAVPWVVIFAGK